MRRYFFLEEERDEERLVPPLDFREPPDDFRELLDFFDEVPLLLRDDDFFEPPDDLREDDDLDERLFVLPPDFVEDLRDDDFFAPPDDFFEPPDDLRELLDFLDDDLRDGTLSPSARASEMPMAIACLRFVTFLPEPLFNFPSPYSCIVLLTLFCAFFP